MTPRWSDSFWRSVGTGRSGLPIIDNTLVITDDELVEVSNPYLVVQQQLNVGLVLEDVADSASGL